MNKIPKGYTITPKVKFLRTKEGRKRTQLVQLVHKRKGIEKLFSSEEFAIKWIAKQEVEKVQKSALAGKGAPTMGKAAILAAGKDLVASKELAGEFDEPLNDIE